MKLKRRQIYLLIILIASIFLSFMIIFAFRKTAQRIVSDFSFPFLSPIPYLEKSAEYAYLMSKTKKELATELAIARKEIMKLETENLVMKKDSEENCELRKLLALKPPPGYKLIFASPIIRDPLAWRETLTLDKGEEDGIKTGAIVLTTSSKSEEIGKLIAVAGRIISVNRHTCVLSTLIGQNCTFGVFLKNAKIPGVLVSAGNSALNSFPNIEYIRKNSGVKEGEIVTTSPFSPEIPPYLPVGKLLNSEKNIESNDFYEKFMLSPFADFDNMKFFAVLVKK